MNFDLFSEKYPILSENVFSWFSHKMENTGRKLKKGGNFSFFTLKKVTNFPQNTTKCRIYERNFFAQYMPHFFKNRCSLNVFCGKFVKNMDDLWEVCQKIWQTSSRSLFLNVLRKCLSPESAPKLAKICGTTCLILERRI